MDRYWRFDAYICPMAQFLKIRSVWVEAEEEWYFAIVDVVGALTESANPRKYWSVLKSRLKAEGSELATKCSQLKMQAADGKFYKTDAATTEQLLRLIQSIPSPKAEPFKLWLASVGAERIKETANPELAIDRAFETYLKKAIRRNGFISGCSRSVSVTTSRLNGIPAASGRGWNMPSSPTR